MSNPVKFSQVTDALSACILAAPEAERAALAAALESWADRYHCSYWSATNSTAPPVLARMMMAVEQASDARIVRI
jgi:hypothetical protein